LELTIQHTLSQAYSYPVWETADPIEIMHLYTMTLNQNWSKQYAGMSNMGKPKIGETEIDYEDMYF
jgi:hypothetical protein